MIDRKTQVKMDSLTKMSRMGLGTGNLASLGRAASLNEVRLLLEVMQELGINVIDTADSYASGDCEKLIGRAIMASGKPFQVVTKAGYRMSNLSGLLRPLNQFIKKAMHKFGDRQCFDPEYLRKSLEGSLSRLGVSVVDSFLLHDPPLDVVKDENVLNMCEKLSVSGMTSKIGVSSGNIDVLSEALNLGIFEVLETPANLGAASQLSKVWDECEARGIRLIANHVYAPQCLRLSNVTHEVLMRACASMLPENSIILCGTRNPEHLRQSSEWAEMPLSVSETQNLMNEFIMTKDR